jgi:hypothetical protein
MNHLLKGMFVASRQVDAGQERATIIFTNLCWVTCCALGYNVGLIQGNYDFFMGPFIKEQNIWAPCKVGVELRI